MMNSPEKPDRPTSTVLARHALRDARQSMVHLQAQVLAGCDYYAAVGSIIEAIDDVAELETGDREHFRAAW